MAGATFAIFSDSGSSNGNVFATGTLELKLTDSTETDQDNVTASFGGFFLPGTCTVFPQTLTIKNTGSIAANSVKIQGTNSNDPFAQYLLISSIQFDGNPVTISDSAPTNGLVDLHDLASGSPITLPGGGLAGGASKNLNMWVCLNSAVDNSFQGANNSLNLTVTLSQ
jgi:hypothetical protein